MVRAITAFSVPSLLALSLACGADTPSTTSSSTAGAPQALAQQACSLLTDDDIREVTGVAPGPSRFESSQCIWPNADGSNQFLVQLILAPTTVRSYDDLEKQYREQLDANPAEAFHRLEGAGDFAVGYNETPMVQIYSRGRMVQVATFEHEERHALDLANRAVGRLK